MRKAFLPQLGDLKEIRELRQLQRERLGFTIDKARQAPFYRDRLPRNNHDLAAQWHEIPFTSKDDLRKAYPFGLLAIRREQVATYHESSGTSGEPTSSYFTENDWDDIASRFARNAVGINSEDSVLIKTPYSMVTTAHQMHRAARLKGALVVPADNRSSNMPYSKVIRILKDVPITVAWCLPTETLLWATAAQHVGLDPSQAFPNFRAFLVAGEPLSEGKRKRIGEVWGKIQVFQDYGSTETGSLAGECPFQKLHLWADRLYCEVLDTKTGKTAPYGKGLLVVTSLFREAMPLVRYVLEDEVQIDPEPCPCGWVLPVVRVLGRQKCHAVIQEKAVFPLDLEEMVFSLSQELGVTFWRSRFDSETLEIEIAPNAGKEQEACDQLTRLIVDKLGIRAFVRSVALNELVATDQLTQTSPFLKPRFLFGMHEDWTKGIHY